MEPGQQGLDLTFEVTPQKEKLYREKLTLVDAADETNKSIITLHCRVLGMKKKYKATII